MTSPTKTLQPRESGTLLHRVLASSACEPREAVIATALDLLALEPEHHVLELGCGTGDILTRLSARVLRGKAVGVDASDLMVRHSRRRNHRFLAHGRAEVRSLEEADLPGFAGASFDRVLAVHVVYFWADPARHLAGVRRVLRPGGRIVLGFRPATGPAGSGRPPAAEVAGVASWLRGEGFDAIERFAAGGLRRPLAWLRARRA